MRLRPVLLVTVVLLAGCGGAAPPDAATSRRLIMSTVLDWHRLQAAGDGEAACRLLTDDQQDRLVELNRDVAAGTEPPPQSCPEVVARYARLSEQFRELMLNTQVDAVEIHGDRATAVAHTHGSLGGTVQNTPPARIPLRWAGGRWLID